MGLFHKKKKDLELELPPPPPPDSEMQSLKPKKIKLPKLPKIRDDKKLAELPPLDNKNMELPPLPKKESKELPPLPPIEKEHIPELPPKKEFEKIPEHKMPPIPNFKELEKDLPPVHDLNELENDLPPLREMGEKEFPTPEFTKIEEEHHPEIVSKEKKVEGPIFVNVNSYRDALNCVTSIRRKIKEGENHLQKLNEIKNSKDKYFEQFRTKLEDLQRKSLYVDKSLFERKKFE